MVEHLTKSDQPDTIKLNKLVSSFRVCRSNCHMTFFSILVAIHRAKVIIDKSRGEVSLLEQDTIENVS